MISDIGEQNRVLLRYSQCIKVDGVLLGVGFCISVAIMEAYCSGYASVMSGSCRCEVAVRWLSLGNV